jgi:hypothetical protein
MYGSYVYRDKSIPKKSGYSTSILVHKEGIMNNEEIYKYADKKLKCPKYVKQSNCLVILGGGGMGLLWGSLVWGQNTLALIIVIVLGVILFPTLVVVWLTNLDTWYKYRRNYIYNLVRADERKRCMTKMERYEHEGSK